MTTTSTPRRRKPRKPNGKIFVPSYAADDTQSEGILSQVDNGSCSASSHDSRNIADRLRRQQRPPQWTRPERQSTTSKPTVKTVRRKGQFDRNSSTVQSNRTSGGQSQVARQTSGTGKQQRTEGSVSLASEMTPTAQGGTSSSFTLVQSAPTAANSPKAWPSKRGSDSRPGTQAVTAVLTKLKRAEQLYEDSLAQKTTPNSAPVSESRYRILQEEVPQLLSDFWRAHEVEAARRLPSGSHSAKASRSSTSTMKKDEIADSLSGVNGTLFNAFMAGTLSSIEQPHIQYLKIERERLLEEMRPGKGKG